MIRWPVLLLFVAFVACGKSTPAKHEPASPATPATKQETAVKPVMDEAAQIAELIDPTKLATLGERRANRRVQQITAILVTAKTSGKNPEEIAQDAVRRIGWANTAKGDLTVAAILRNRAIAEKLGATTPEDIAAMKKGNAATVRYGPYAGDILSVDHVIPRSVAPQLDNVISNLELMPLKLNERKGDKIGDRQRSLAKKLHDAGLLADPGKLR